MLLFAATCLGAGAASARTVEGALLQFDETSHNFGDVQRKGGDLEYDFEFVNAGKKPLVLMRVLTSCSCLKASFSKRPVAPGARGVIRITYEPLKREPGVFNKVIQVYSNSERGREVIAVQGNSIEGDPRGKVKSGKSKVKYK